MKLTMTRGSSSLFKNMCLLTVAWTSIVCAEFPLILSHLKASGLYENNCTFRYVCMYFTLTVLVNKPRHWSVLRWKDISCSYNRQRLLVLTEGSFRQTAEAEAAI